MSNETDVSIGKFDILATYTYARALLDGTPANEAKQRGIVAAIMGAKAKLGHTGGSQEDHQTDKAAAEKKKKTTITGASRCQPLFLVFGRSVRYRTEANSQPESGCNICGRRKHGRDFLARECGLQYHRTLAPRRSAKESPAVVSIGAGVNSHPQRIRSMIAALTEGVRPCQLATNSLSASSSRPISGQPLSVMS
jgi:hypothetical protein